jgi:hypothetical protein
MPVDPTQSDEIFDVVIIGAGAAGITLALQLSEAGVKTALVEGGGYTLSDSSQDLYKGITKEEDYPLAGTRLRFFGGSTNHWGGWCHPFSNQAFKPRPSINYPGWPIDGQHLTPYLDKALNLVDIESSVIWDPMFSDKPSSFDLSLSKSEFNEIYFNWSPPTRFKTRYLDRLRDYDTLTLSVNDSLINFEFTSDGEITGAVLRNLYSHEDRVICGKQFVLACGGIENARLLLHINAQNDVDFGNRSGDLGKYFMEHPEFRDVGQLAILDKTYSHDSFPNAWDNWQLGFRFFHPSYDFIKQHNMLDVIIRMKIDDGLNDSQIFEELSAKTNLTGQSNWQAYTLDMVLEQPPLITNTITLSEQIDDLGVNKTILTWDVSDNEYYAARQTLLAFARFLVEADIGRCKLAPWVFDEKIKPKHKIFGHHMGTTRMANTESEGVVDTNCRLFGTKNLYVAGSSVYPTSDSINPTLTIVQLTLRLSDHILSRLSE